MTAAVVLACWRIGQAWVVYPEFVLYPLGAALVVGRAWRPRPARAAWFLLAFGLFSYSTSTLLGLFSNQYAWLPSQASTMTALVGFAGLIGALIMLLRRDAPMFRATTALDAVSVTLGVFAAGIVFFEPLVRRTADGADTARVLLIYPAGDVVVLCIAMGALATLGWPWRGRWGWVAAGLAVMLAIDSLYAVGALDGTYTGSLIVDMLWPFGAVGLVNAAWRDDRPAGTPTAGAGLWVLPFTVTLGSLTLVACDAYGLNVSTLASWIACLALLSVFIRMALTFAEVAELTETRHQAHHDDLTGLANRRAFYLRLESGLRHNGPLALLIMDLNRFKDVNDALGHGVGDELLAEVARRLSTDLSDVLAAGGMIARLGGDEFAVVLDGGGRTEGEATARRVGRTLSEAVALDDITLHVGASIGLALAPEHAGERTALMRCADIAMYEAKRARKPFAVYSGRTDQQDRARLEMLEQLRIGLTRGEFLCWFQPKADLSTGRIIGAEALARWRHPEHGMLAPDVFLPLVEESGQMRLLTEIVLERALSACQGWRDAGDDLVVAVNLSAANLLDADLISYISLSLQRFGLPGRRLRLEITEDVLLADPIRAAQTVDALRGIGVGVSMDDYGTGYSSLSHLRQLLIDELKLDRSFVTDLSTRPRDLAIVSSTIDLAHALDLVVVAEGVESEADWQTLTRLGCDQAQGYLLSRPLPPEQFLTFLTTHSRAGGGPDPATPWRTCVGRLGSSPTPPGREHSRSQGENV